MASLFDECVRRASEFFWRESHPISGLTKDRAKNSGRGDSYTVCSIASTGYALASLGVSVERGWRKRRDAEARARLTLRFLSGTLPHEHGFFYHFVDWRTGARVWDCELSSVDTSLLVLGALVSGAYFGGECRELADGLLDRLDWRWMQNREAKDSESIAPSMGWKPESGFLSARWGGYTEAGFLYVLALAGSSGRVLPASAWEKLVVPSANLEGFPVFAGPTPIFWAQMTPGFFDWRGRKDRAGRNWWANFENAHRGHIAFCSKNEARFSSYQGGIFGINACDQPPPVGYGAQEPRDGRHDGTIAPTAVLAARLFVPSDSERALRALDRRFKKKLWGRYGFGNAFNADKDWYDPDVLGIDLGMALLCLENARSGLIWNLLRNHPRLADAQKSMFPDST